MSTGWVAATVRAKAMARRRVGAGAARRIAEAPTLDAGLALLAGTAFEPAAKSGDSLRDVEHHIRAAVLWELRVLAGWLPASGIPLARALAARFEMADVERHVRRLKGRPAEPMFELGTLATSWPRLAATSSPEELRGELAASPWGDPGDLSEPGAPADLHDGLTAGWLRMLAAAARTGSGMAGSAVIDWVAGGAALLAARIAVVAGTTPSDQVVRLAAPLIGRGWTVARTVDELRAALPTATRRALADVSRPSELWRAEARLRGRLESDGFRMLRAARPGPDPVVGALAVLAVDAWRVRASLACAATGTGPGEVLDVVA